jgi:hypothetical protein
MLASDALRLPCNVSEPPKVVVEGLERESASRCSNRVVSLRSKASELVEFTAGKRLSATAWDELGMDERSSGICENCETTLVNMEHHSKPTEQCRDEYNV